MTLREYLNAYGGVTKIYIETPDNTELFRDISLLPEEYLNRNILKWTNKIDGAVLGTNRFNITPVITLVGE